MGLAACNRSQGEAGGSDRQDKEQKPQAGLPELELESRMRSRHEPQLGLVGHCNWLWRGGSRLGEAEY